MNLILETLGGQLTARRLDKYTAPNGLFIAAKQDAPATVPTSRQLGSLFSVTSVTIPNNLELHHNGAVYAFHSGDWYGTTNYTVANSVAVSGAVNFRNPTNTDLEVSW